MDTIIGILIGILILIFIFVLYDQFTKFQYRKKLSVKSLNDLKLEVFRYEKEYFDFIGNNHDDVVTFRRLVDEENLKELARQWGGLSNKFRILEADTGHKGRPLIMDYYLDYDQAVKMLIKRTTQPDHSL